MRNTILHKHAFIPLMLATAGVLVFAAAFFTGCEREGPIVSEPLAQEEQLTIPKDVLNEIAELRRIAASPDRGLAYWTEDGTDHPPVIVPAGSVDALAAAIAAAGNNGKVILASGLHTENHKVTISSRVTIVGQNGAVLKLNTDPVTSPAEPWVVDVGLHIFNANNVNIWNIDFVPVGPIGGTAIVVENSPRTSIGCNSFNDFQWSVLLQNAKNSTIFGNEVHASTAWQTAVIPEADGIINLNGKGVVWVDNEFTGGVLGAFLSDADNIFLHNNLHDNFVGMILCCVPEGLFQLPSGAIVGSLVSGTKSFVQGNTGSNNFYAGFLVIDGANKNLLVNNGGSGNGAYDIELLGGTCLFGFFTPTSFNNTVVVGSHQNITINDFGQNNRIIGHATVTNNISAPCP